MSTLADRVAIVGGGIGGLAVAYELQRSGLGSFVLFEASPRLGGIVETVRRDTRREDLGGRFVVECGPDAWVTEKPWARDLAIELGLGDEIIPSNDAIRRTLILQDGQLIPMPDGMRMMVPTNLEAIDDSPLFTAEARQGYRSEPGRAEELKANAPPVGPEGDEPVASFVRRHFGEEVATRVAGPLLAGVFGGSIERLSVQSVMPAFVKMEREHGSLILALQSKTLRRSSAEPSPPIFTTLASGLGTLVDAMAATLPSGVVRRNSPVGSIEQKGAHWLVSTDAGVEEFDSVVLATPAHVSRQLLTPLHARLGELLDIEASSAIVVALAFAPEEAAALTIPQGFGFLVPQTFQPPNSGPHPSQSHAVSHAKTDSEPSLLACTFVDQKFAHRVPEGGVLLRAFFGGEAAPALLGESDELLAARARRQLVSILGPLPKTLFTVVRRWPRSLPQYEVGHQSRVEKMEQLAGEFPGLHLAGNSYYGVGLPDLVRDGRALARKLVG